ncbi:AAA family ATPase [Photobacterium leiognathi]|nr:AAA family ATPase [Photobacterium leiognathi]
MYLHKLRVQGFKRLVDIEIEFNSATFLIGQNNSGKSSLIKAVEYLLTNKQIPIHDFHSYMNQETQENERLVDTITMTAEFRNVSIDADNWRGFRGRTFEY